MTWKLYTEKYRDLALKVNGEPLDFMSDEIPSEFLPAGVVYTTLIRESHLRRMSCRDSGGVMPLIIESEFLSEEPRKDGITDTVRNFAREMVSYIKYYIWIQEMEILFDRVDYPGYIQIHITKTVVTILCMDPFVEEMIPI